MSDTGNNTSRSAIPEPVASRGELEAFIDFLNDNEGSGDCAFGKEIEFFERNDFHLSIANQMFLGFKHKVNGFQSPLAIRIPHPEDEINDENGRDDDYVFAVAVQLRNYFRGKFGKPPLTEQEVRDFGLGIPPLPDFGNRPSARRVPQPPEKNLVLISYNLSDDEVETAADYLVAHYPEVVTYIKALDVLAPNQEYDNRYDVFGGMWVSRYIETALYATLPSLKNYHYILGDNCIREMINSKF